MKNKNIQMLSAEECEKKIYSLLGLAQKAGQIAAGDDAVTLALKKNQAQMVILAADSAENIKQKLHYTVKTYTDVKIYNFGKKDLLGAACGKTPKAVIAVKDQNFAAGIKNLLQVMADKQNLS